MRRTHLRGHRNILERLLIHVAAFNLSPILRREIGVGTPRGLQDRPSGRVISSPPKGMYWRVSKESFERLNQEGRIWWGKDGDNVPRPKRFLSEVKEGLVPETIWPHGEVGNTQEAKKELLAVCDFEDSGSVFITPKPLRLLKRILEIASAKDSLILDSFAGSLSSRGINLGFQVSLSLA